MSEDEYKRLRVNAEDKALADLQKGRVNGVVAWAVIDTALSTGLRCKEIVGLTVEHLDVKLEALTVSRAKKRHRSAETIPLDKSFVRHMKDYLRWRSEWLKDLDGQRRSDLDRGRKPGQSRNVKSKKKAKSVQWSCPDWYWELDTSERKALGTSGALFVGQRGPMTVRGAAQIFKAAAERAGLREELSIHSTRHTHAKRMYNATKDLRMVQNRLGHSKPAVTANMYLDCTFEDTQTALNRMSGDTDEGDA
jgi:integrase